MSKSQLHQHDLFAQPRPTQVGGVRIGYSPDSSPLAPAKGFMDDYDYTLNQYSGCGFGCSYCYAAFFPSSLEKRETWGQWVEAKVSSVEKLARKRDLIGKKIYMSSVTDPYQPLEANLELTRRILELLVQPDRQPRLVVQTRSPLVLRDIDLFKKFEHLRVNVTLTTDDDEIRKRFEPGCPSNRKRIETIRELKEAGLKVGVCVAPMLPLRDVESFGETLRDLNADVYVTQPFKASNQPFSANTRTMAIELADAYGWNDAAYVRNVQVLRKLVPGLLEGKAGFMPE